MTEQPIPYVRELRSELVHGIDRARSRRVRGRVALAAAAAAAAVALTLGLWLPDGGGGSSALAVTKQDGWITLRIADATADPDQMTAELRAAGIDGEVTVRPVSPSLVGRWAAVETRPSAAAKPGEAVSVTELIDEPPRARDAADVERLLSIDFDPDALRVPEDFDGGVLLTAGREPRGDELYAESGSAFAPGEPLHCTGIERLPRSEAERAIAARGYEVHTVAEVEEGEGDVGVGAQLLSTRPMAPNVGRRTSRREIGINVSS